MRNDFFKNEEDIIEWLNKNSIRQYALVKHNEFGYIVNIDANVELAESSLDKIPVKFGKITGSFNCSYNHLEDLDFAPYEVGDFNCSNNKIRSLKGCPEEVDFFNCSHNGLTSLKGGPQRVNKSYYCSHNNLHSLKGVALIIKESLDCSYNQLTTLKYCPKIIEGFFTCNNNQLTSLEHVPEKIKVAFDCSHNQIRNFIHFPQEVGNLIGIKDSCKLYKNPWNETQFEYERDFYKIFEKHLEDKCFDMNEKLKKQLSEKSISIFKSKI